MSNYSFMKSGFNSEGSAMANPFEGFSEEDIQILLSLFVSNAMINAAKYSKLAGRNGVTKTDVEYGLKYEVFEFFQREDLLEGYEEIKRDMEEELQKESENIRFGVDYFDTRLGQSFEHDETFDTLEEAEEWVEKNNCEYYKDVEIFEIEPDPMEGHVVDDEDIEDFSRAEIQKVDVEDRNFIQSIHQYFEQWKTWEPDTALKLILKNGVDKINESGL